MREYGAQNMFKFQIFLVCFTPKRLSLHFFLNEYLLQIVLIKLLFFSASVQFVNTRSVSERNVTLRVTQTSFVNSRAVQCVQVRQ